MFFFFLYPFFCFPILIFFLSCGDSVTRLLPSGSQNKNKRCKSVLFGLFSKSFIWYFMCFPLCVCFQCVTGSGQRWRGTSWWRSTIPLSSNCIMVSQTITDLPDESLTPHQPIRALLLLLFQEGANLAVETFSK